MVAPLIRRGTERLHERGTIVSGIRAVFWSGILQGFHVVLQVDGYTGYNCLLDPKTNGDILLAHCWAHARRKLFELTQ